MKLLQTIASEMKFDVIVPEATCCGRLACILIEHEGKALRVYGNAIDYPAGEPMKARRIRVQRGCPELHGRMLQPHQYQWQWWADEEED